MESIPTDNTAPPVLWHWQAAIAAAKQRNIALTNKEIIQAVNIMIHDAKNGTNFNQQAIINFHFLKECIPFHGKNYSDFLDFLEYTIGQFRTLSDHELWGVFTAIVLPLTEILYAMGGAKAISSYWDTFPVKGPAMHPYTEDNHVRVCEAFVAPVRQHPISRPPRRPLPAKPRILFTGGTILADHAGWRLIANTVKALTIHASDVADFQAIGQGTADLNIGGQIIRAVPPNEWLTFCADFDLTIVSGISPYRSVQLRQTVPNLALHSLNFDWSPCDAEILFSSIPPADGRLSKEVRGRRWDSLPSLFPLHGQEIPHTGSNIVFGTFGRVEKIADPQFLATVRHILDQVPGARYHWCSAVQGLDAPEYAIRLLDQAGILERSVFRGWVSADEFARDVDVHLESFPFGTATAAFDLLARGRVTVSLSGHLTTYALIWKPLVTSGFGDAALAAHARAMLKLDTDQSLWLEAKDQQEYISLAVSLARDAAWRRQVWLAYRELAGPLSDGRHVATAFGAAFQYFRASADRNAE